MVFDDIPFYLKKQHSWEFLNNIRRYMRRLLVKKVVSMVRGMGFGDELGGFLLKVWHFSAPWLIVANVYSMPKGLALFNFFCLITALCVYFILGGCFLSEAEYKLGAGNVNVVDPYIILCNHEVSLESRLEFTIYGAGLSVILVLSTLHLRGFI
tara:strand:- start:5678 stop:6139 length:462 start_codon:yes stop_codon:yes gene_type:complete